MVRPPHRSARLWVAAVAGLAAALLPLAAGASKRSERKKEEARAIEALPEKYRGWLEEVEVLISDEERQAFLALTQDYQRDAFIDRFWKARDTYPDTARNEFRDRWQERVQTARVSYGDLHEDRARLMLLNGEPADVRKVECSALLWPTEIWYYAGSDRLGAEFFLVFYRRGGTGPYRLWRNLDGLGALFQQATGLGATENVASLLTQIRNACYRGDEVAAILASIVAQGVFGYEAVLEEATSEPEAPEGEWVTTFNAYSTDLPEGAATLAGTLQVQYPGRRQSRTVVQGLLEVPAAAAEPAALGDYRAYNFVLNGEVLAGEELFDAFRYRFDFPLEEVAGQASLPMAFQRLLRPGPYRLVVKLEDVNGRKFLRLERAIEVPALDGAPPRPAAPEVAALLAEANAALATGDVALDLVEPQGELLTGMRRIDALLTGPGVVRVAFRLDGREVLVKTRPPWSVELDLGSLPRTRTLAAIAYDASGAELASDELLLNASSHRFRVRLIEPRRGARYGGSLVARADVSPPEGRSIERVEFFLDEARVATLYQPPWEQPIVLPGGDGVAYVQAVAYLPDGNSTQDLVFVNAPEGLDEQMEIEFVELYTTVLDREGRPVLGLAQGDFAVLEDGVAQEVRRFERVADLPIHVAALLDVSASMEASLGTARDAALAFFQETLTPKDRGAVVLFNDRPELAVKLTGDLRSLAAGLSGLKAERGTALYDSLVFALHYFNGITGQRALLVLSDGKDESSRFRFEDALEYARRAGVTIYAIGLDLPKGEPRRKLADFAAETGGRSFFVEGAAGLPAIYASIEEELRSQYLLAYQSTNTGGGEAFRAVEVKLARTGLEAKTLRGYYP